MKEQRSIFKVHPAVPEQEGHVSADEATGGTAAAPGCDGRAAGTPGQVSSMAEPVTRHALIPPSDDFQYLLCGFDSLDIGLFVEWGTDWPIKLTSFHALKEKAQKIGEVLEETTPNRKYIFFPNGKGDNYTFHLQFPEFHLYIAKTEKFTKSPNVYLSINSDTMWKKGVEHALNLVASDLESFGGKIDSILPSRLDICADFKLSPGLTLPFLEEHTVCRSRDMRPIIKGGILETCYFGSPAAPIRLRIYDKGKEVLKKGEKLWFADLWETKDLENIWRIEFQLRRPALKQLKINDLEDLWQKAGGVWNYLTGEWFSLRLLDNDRQDRRSIHPLWQEVQACTERLGKSIRIRRDFSSESHASAQFYISHIAGCLPSFAARGKKRTRDFKKAIYSLSEALFEHWQRRDFKGEVDKRTIKLGQIPDIVFQRPFTDTNEEEYFQERLAEIMNDGRLDDVEAERSAWASVLLRRSDNGD